MENVAAQTLLFHRSHPSTRSVPRFSFSSGCCILDGSPAATTIGRRLSRMANQCVANGSPWSGQRKFRKLSPSNESGGGDRSRKCAPYRTPGRYRKREFPRDLKKLVMRQLAG